MEKLKIFVCEQYHIIGNDKRNFALMLSRTSDDRAAKLFTTCLHTEMNALENLIPMAQKLAIDKTKIHEYEPLPGCQSYTNYLTKLAVYHTVIEAVTVESSFLTINFSKPIRINSPLYICCVLKVLMVINISSRSARQSR